ncbi:hypothetical protein [Flavobacterium sp. N3904]|uniref:hypothetical protein n=1 Tax=Flavobacterium sp. N3904 TaxID=2986835 RepID=UPI002224D61D|nr:hypothetical protein [Flavobacterium sp. N3904]
MRKLEELKENEFSMICDSLNGVILDFKPINWRIRITDDLIEGGYALQSKWKVDIDELEYKLDCLSNTEFLKLLVKVDLFWQNDERHYTLINSISPKSKILEITDATQKHEPIIWDSHTEGSLSDFFMVALGLNLDYIIYVQDSEGNINSIWATTEDELLECMFTISEYLFLGCIDTLQNSLKKGGWFYFNEENKIIQ